MVRQCIDVNDNAKLNVVHLVSHNFENIFIPLWCGWFVYEVGYCNDFSNIGKSDLNIQTSEGKRHVKDDAKWIFPILLLVQTPEREVIKWQKSVRKIKSAQQQTDELMCACVCLRNFPVVNIRLGCGHVPILWVLLPNSLRRHSHLIYYSFSSQCVSVCEVAGRAERVEKKTLKSSQMQSPRKHLRISFRLPTR